MRSFNLLPMKYIFILVLFIVSCGKSPSRSCLDTNCANYTSQSDAQAAFDADPECRNDLDQDKDGIACEEPGNSVKNCQSTSNCGCSNKTKSECGDDPCCKWVVGEGCKCK